jgi:hypothetical protein
MRTVLSTVLACAIVMGVFAPAFLSAQTSGLGSLIPDKAVLLEQARKLVTQLTSLKQDPNLALADKAKVDALLPQATAVNSELAQPQVEPNRLARLAGQLGDLQKQVSALKGGG